jgi:signal transduction histidine kinase
VRENGLTPFPAQGGTVTDPMVPPTTDTLVALSRLATTARLLAGAVHEVNNALLVISGTVELLEARTDLPEPVARGLERLRRQGTRAAAALTEVTAFTQAPLEKPGDVHLQQLASGAVDLRRFAVSRAGLTIVLNPGDACIVRGNYGQLQQAVLNVIISAELALKGRHGQIVVDARPDGRWGMITISDDRPAGTLAPDAFEPFAKGRPPTDITGLSLFAARASVEAQGGTLTVDEAAAGTAIVIRVPRLMIGATA